MTTEAPPRPGLSRAERASLRLRRQRRRRRITTAIVLAALLLVGAAVYIVRFTSVLGLSTIRVQAADGELAPELTEQVLAEVPPADGTPLITIDLDQVRADVLEVPRVADAAVARTWPDTLVVTVTPRVPEAVVKANDSWWLLDEHGLPYDRVPEEERATLGLPVLRLATPGESDPATVAALGVAADLTDELHDMVTVISARTAYDITLELSDGRTVHWGDTAHAQKKMQVLAAVLSQAGTHFDISDPELVTVN